MKMLLRMLNNLPIAFKCWMLIAIVVSGLAGLLYTTAQQVLRSGANDPQIQMAEDAAATLAAGGKIQHVVPTEQVDIAKSLALYMIVFDDTGQPLASSALLDGQIPTIPGGVFDYTRQNGEDRITWQPQPGVRSAIVVTRFQGATSGFVLVGRSLREVEIREDNLLHIDLIGWLGILIVTFFTTMILFWRSSKAESA